MKRRATPFVFAAIFSFLSATALHERAFAQRAPSQAAAQALFEEGRKLMNAGKYSEACPKLAESQRLDPGAGTLINLAACYEKNGQTASAWATYKEAVSESEKSNRREWAQRARQRAAALEPVLPKMIVAVPESSRAAGLVVKRDGVEVGTGEWGVAIPVDPGSHAIEVTAPGRKPWASAAQVGRSKDVVTVTVPLLEAAPQATAEAPPAAAPSGTDRPPSPVTLPPHEDKSGSGQRTLGLVVGGVGVAGLAVGAIFGLQAMASKDEAAKNCTTDLTTCRNQAGIDSVDQAKGQATISTIAVAAGAALTAAGIVLVLTAPKATTTGATRWLHVGSVGSGVGVAVGGGL